jgi:hypothetical protein
MADAAKTTMPSLSLANSRSLSVSLIIWNNEPLSEGTSDLTASATPCQLLPASTLTSMLTEQRRTQLKTDAYPRLMVGNVSPKTTGPKGRLADAGAVCAATEERVLSLVEVTPLEDDAFLAGPPFEEAEIIGIPTTTVSTAAPIKK